MIKANELRIGNKILATGLHEGKVMTVEQIGTKATLSESKRVIMFKEHDVGEFVEDCSAITLNSEWCERMGFKKEPDTINYDIPTYSVGDLIIRHENNEWHFIYKDKRLKTITYVHQLQNLHFYLTGVELKIEL